MGLWTSGCVFALVRVVVEVSLVGMCSIVRWGNMFYSVEEVIRLTQSPWMRMGISFWTGGGEETNMVHHLFVATCRVVVISVLLI